MPHLHSIYDTDLHFSINPITRATRNESSIKKSLIQGDHNSERFTFEIPRFVEGHDMSLCTKIEVHYINVSSANKSEQSKDVYLALDAQISPEDENVVIFSWLISRNATKYAGTLSFLIKFTCLTDDNIDYEWNTDIYSDISIGKGMNNGETVMETPTDVLEGWKAEILADVNGSIERAESCANEAYNHAENAAKSLESAREVEDTIKALLNEYVDDVDALIGG